MPLPSLYLTRPLPAPLMETIRQRYTLVSEPQEGHIPTVEEMRCGFAEADAVICTLADQISDVLFATAPRLKIVATYAVGYNNIDVAAAARRGIVVTNTPDVLTNATADLAWALLLAVARRVVEGDQWVRTGQWPGWAPTQMLGADVTGKTLGVIGMGRIGQAMARRAQGFEMPVLYAARRPLPPPLSLPGWSHRPLEDVVAEADFLSLHVPLTESTRHLIGSRELGHMKRSAILINTARGPVVDETALLDALRSRTIAGAGLDVYEREPTLLAGLEQCPNAVLLPHLGSATTDTRLKMGVMCLENIAAVLAGRPPLNPVRSS